MWFKAEIRNVRRKRRIYSVVSHGLLRLGRRELRSDWRCKWRECGCGRPLGLLLWVCYARKHLQLVALPRQSPVIEIRILRGNKWSSVSWCKSQWKRRHSRVLATQSRDSRSQMSWWVLKITKTHLSTLYYSSIKLHITISANCLCAV